VVGFRKFFGIGLACRSTIVLRQPIVQCGQCADVEVKISTSSALRDRNHM
jgi:hypothetical protein